MVKRKIVILCKSGEIYLKEQKKHFLMVTFIIYVNDVNGWLKCIPLAKPINFENAFTKTIYPKQALLYMFIIFQTAWVIHLYISDMLSFTSFSFVFSFNLGYQSPNRTKAAHHQSLLSKLSK